MSTLACLIAGLVTGALLRTQCSAPWDIVIGCVVGCAIVPHAVKWATVR